MGDLITKNCPSCGGKLEVGSNTSVLRCEHCHSEHLVRRDAGGISLESFARCPKCGRNDRVEKVSTTLRSHSQEITVPEIRAESYYDQNGNQLIRTIEVPITHVQYTGLGKSFVLPSMKPELIPKPEDLPMPDILPEPSFPHPQYFEINLIKVGFLILSLSIIFLFFITSLPEGYYSSICVIPFLLNIIIGILVLSFGIIRKSRKKGDTTHYEIEKQNKIEEWEKENLNNLIKWHNQNQIIIDKWEEHNRLLMQSWQKAMDNWNKLYFCHRDESVFVEGDNSYAPIEDMESYLYKDFPKPMLRNDYQFNNQKIISQPKTINENQDILKHFQENISKQGHIPKLNSCPFCGCTNVSSPKRKEMSFIWLIFIVISMGLGRIFWLFTPKYDKCDYCGATWKV